MLSSKLAKCVILAQMVLFTSAKPTVYLIRHGEKPSDGSNGLNAQGLERSKCLVKVFGQSSSYDIGHIMAQTPDPDGSRKRPLDTVVPLANSLGLKVDVHCDRDDHKCVKDTVKDYDGPGNILICWEHDTLTDIVEELGNKHAPKYPGSRFDLIWTDPADYSKIVDQESECCLGLDSC